MKKLIGLTAVLALALGLTACGSGNDKSESSDSKGGDTTKLVVGATTSPHGEILAEAKPLLAKEGVDLEVKDFTDYTLINKATVDGELDANYFQHKPYLDQQNKDNGWDLADAGAIHIEPMGIYSKDIKSVDDIKEGTTVVTSNSVSDWGRILQILADAKLITLKDGVNIETATFDDVATNPKNLKFKHDVDTGMLVPTYQSETDALVAINANFALTADMDPTKDALLLEKDNSPYANIIATRKGDESSDAVKKLVEVLHSDEIKKFVDEKWKGSVKIVE